MTHEDTMLKQRIPPGSLLEVVTGFEEYATVTNARPADSHNSLVAALRNDP